MESLNSHQWTTPSSSSNMSTLIIIRETTTIFPAPPHPPTPKSLVQKEKGLKKLGGSMRWRWRKVGREKVGRESGFQFNNCRDKLRWLMSFLLHHEKTVTGDINQSKPLIHNTKHGKKHIGANLQLGYLPLRYHGVLGKVSCFQSAVGAEAPGWRAP